MHLLLLWLSCLVTHRVKCLDASLLHKLTLIELQRADFDQRLELCHLILDPFGGYNFAKCHDLTVLDLLSEFSQLNGQQSLNYVPLVLAKFDSLAYLEGSQCKLNREVNVRADLCSHDEALKALLKDHR